MQFANREVGGPDKQDLSAGSGLSSYMPRSDRLMLGWAFVAATVLAAIFAAGWAIRAAGSGQTADWSLLVFRAAVEWYAWFALVPAVFSVSRRWVITAGEWQPLLAHAGAALVLFLANTMIIVAAALVARPYGLDPLGIGTFDPQMALQAVFGRRLETNVVVYGMLVTACHAVAAHRAALQRETLAQRAVASAQQAQLRRLQGQLDPHYVFNALNTVAELAHSVPEQSKAVAVRLARLLRAGESAPTVTLREEIARTRDYLDIEAIRFNDRLEVIYSVPASVLDYCVPACSVQTLAEIAVRQGPPTGGGAWRLTLAARLESDQLQIELARPGSSADAEQALAGLSEQLALLYQGRARVYEELRERGALRLELPATCL